MIICQSKYSMRYFLTNQTTIIDVWDGNEQFVVRKLSIKNTLNQPFASRGTKCSRSVNSDTIENNLYFFSSESDSYASDNDGNYLQLFQSVGEFPDFNL